MAFEAASDTRRAAPAEQAIGPYLRAVRRHGRVVALVTLVAVAVALATVQRAGVQYAASASVLVTPLPPGDAGFVGVATVVDTGDPARTVQTAAALIDTPDAAAATATQLGPPWTTQSVLKAVTVTPRGASDVLAVTGQASSPRDAERLANAFAEQAVSYRAMVVQRQIQLSINQLQAQLNGLRTNPGATVQVQTLAGAIEQLKAVQGTGREPTLSVSQSAASATQSGASRALVVLLAIVGGFALGSIAALGLEVFSRPVRDREEITSLYPLPVLAALPRIAGRRRQHGTPPWALPPEVFEQLRMLRVQLSLSSRASVIMVTSAGAGDGKTTVAAALAAAFAEAHRNVILMDLDVRKPDLPKLLGIGTDGARRPPLGVPLTVPGLPGVQVMTAPEGNIGNFETLVDRLPVLLAQARRTADVVIIDTAPVGEVSEALRIAPVCDKLIFVARPRHTDRRRLTLARDLLERAGASPAGLVLVGKDTGLPHGDNSYAYAMSPWSPNGNSPARRVPAVVSVPPDAGDDLELD